MLTKDRLVWVADNARPALSPCLCGCGELVKSRFSPGHDGALKAELTTAVKAGGHPSRTARRALTEMGWVIPE